MSRCLRRKSGDDRACYNSVTALCSPQSIRGMQTVGKDSRPKGPQLEDRRAEIENQGRRPRAGWGSSDGAARGLESAVSSHRVLGYSFSFGRLVTM